MNDLLTWFKEHAVLTGWLAGASIVTLVASALLVPVLVARMRADYFLPERDSERMFANRHPVIRWTGLILKNLFGALLFLSGLIMLATPGQGLITMFVGMILMDFPGKRRLELRIIRIGAVYRAIDWIRRRAGREPLRLPES